MTWLEWMTSNEASVERQPPVEVRADHLDAAAAGLLGQGLDQLDTDHARHAGARRDPVGYLAVGAAEIEQNPVAAGLERPQDRLPVLLLGGAEHALQVAHPAGEYMSAPARLSARDDLAVSAVRLTTPPGCRA